MSRTSMARGTIVVAAALVLTVAGAAGGASAAPRAAAVSPGSGLAAAMLDTQDLPAGFTTDTSLTGPLDGQRARAVGIDPSQLGAHEALVRGWLAPRRAEEVVETGVDAWTGDDARTGVTAARSDLVRQGAVRQTLPGAAHLAAYGMFGQVNGTRLFVLALPMSRGPYDFGLRVYTTAASAAAAGPLLSNLAAAQSAKVPAGTPDTASPGSFAAGAAGGTVGLLFGYLLMADGIAYWRNPLGRRHPLRRRRPARLPSGPGVTDVSAAAKKDKRTAVWRLVAQFAGLGLAAYGADVLLVRFWYAYLAAGLAVVWAGGRFIRPAGVRHHPGRALMAGRRKIVVTAMLTAAAAMILAGLACAVFAGLYQALPQGGTVALVPGQPPVSVQSIDSDLRAAAVILVTLGAIAFRSARRLGSVRARELMLRDPRQAVLYLRSFGDDRLKLWTATFGRPSLIERFTPRRFDTFEEVLVRHLSGYGPVIAVNPPGTRLAPLGAARETIDSAGWQAAVASWMAQSRLIVIAAPPSQMNDGLRWELEAVSASGYWDKTLIVVPPVRAEQLRARWHGLLGDRLWPFTVPGPVADPNALVLAFGNGQWHVISADRRTEWSYGAALERALGDPRPGRAAAARPAPDPVRTRRGPLTLPIAALIVVLAAAAGGVGSWYAVRPGSRGAPVEPAADRQPGDIGVGSPARRHRLTVPVTACVLPGPLRHVRITRPGGGRVPRRRRDPAGDHRVLPGHQRPGLRRLPHHPEPRQRADPAAVPGRVPVDRRLGRGRHRHHHRARRASGRRRFLHQPPAAARRPRRGVVHRLAGDHVLRRRSPGPTPSGRRPPATTRPTRPASPGQVRRRLAAQEAIVVVTGISDRRAPIAAGRGVRRRRETLRNALLRDARPGETTAAFRTLVEVSVGNRVTDTSAGAEPWSGVVFS